MTYFVHLLEKDIYSVLIDHGNHKLAFNGIAILAKVGDCRICILFDLCTMYDFGTKQRLLTIGVGTQ